MRFCMMSKKLECSLQISCELYFRIKIRLILMINSKYKTFMERHHGHVNAWFNHLSSSISISSCSGMASFSLIWKFEENPISQVEAKLIWAVFVYLQNITSLFLFFSQTRKWRDCTSTPDYWKRKRNTWELWVALLKHSFPWSNLLKVLTGNIGYCLIQSSKYNQISS